MSLPGGKHWRSDSQRCAVLYQGMGAHADMVCWGGRGKMGPGGCGCEMGIGGCWGTEGV